MTLPFSSSIPAEDPLKLDECRCVRVRVLTTIYCLVVRAAVVGHRTCPVATLCALHLTRRLVSPVPYDLHAKTPPATCRVAGRYMLQLLKTDTKPRDIMTRAAFDNAMTIVVATGGSTNAVLHLIAMARAVGLKLSLDDFQRISDRTPFLADLKPSGKCAPRAPSLFSVYRCIRRAVACLCAQEKYMYRRLCGAVTAIHTAALLRAAPAVTRLRRAGT